MAYVEMMLPGSREDASGIVATIGKVRKLLTPKNAWIKNRENNQEDMEEWEDKKRDGTKGLGPKPPAAYCLIGGAQKVNGLLEEMTVSFLEGLLAMQGFDEIPDFNDDKKTTHKDVLNFLDRAQVVMKSMIPMLPSKKSKKGKKKK